MKSTVFKPNNGERMDIDALSKAHEKLKRKSQRQRERIEELEDKQKELLSGEALELAIDCKSINLERIDLPLKKLRLKSKLYSLVRLLTPNKG